MKNYHTPVLLDEVLSLLIHDQTGTYIDCTMGEGGHSCAVLDHLNQNGRLISLDQDFEMLTYTSSLDDGNDPRWIREHINFRYLNLALQKYQIQFVDGIFADLGLSMFHYKASKKGFSLNHDAPLDMSFNLSELSAKMIVNELSAQEIQSILWKYGEEKAAKRIAEFIVFYREHVKTIETTKELADIIKKGVDSLSGGRYHKIHPATKSFQALRIAVNKELESLEILLEHSLKLLKSGGTFVVLTYHSLEDRIVKQFIQDHKKNFRAYSKKPIFPSSEEIKGNRAARSAKLRFFVVE